MTRRTALLAAALAGALACRRGGYPPAFGVPSPELRSTGYRVRWEGCDFPSRVPAGARVLGRVRFRNTGTDVWHGTVHCAHWFVAAGRPLREGRDPASRVLLQRPVAPGQDVTLERFAIEAPARPGDYLLVFDLVDEGVAWFSDRGAPPLSVPVRVE